MIHRSIANKVGRRNVNVAIRSMSTAPSVKPADPRFGSGPCKKRPNWDLKAIADGAYGRSHRSKLGKKKLNDAIEESKRILGVPQGYELGILPGSDTGAFECAMWSMLGPREIDCFFWESFGKGWNGDILKELKLKDKVKTYDADYGLLPDLTKARKDADVIFTYNGTTSGVRVPNCDWIASDRTGLTFCDATSAAFAMDMEWEKLDITTYSFQKVLGGEGAHGVLILSPRAIERLESHTPSWPMPKVFRLTKNGKLNKGIFEGSTINTPSMMVIEDYLDSLKWADSVGGVKGMVTISQENLDIVRKWVEKSPYASFLAKDPATVSSTSICLALDGISKDGIKKMVALLDKEGVAYDIGSYRDAPPGLRIWGGATVDPSDMEKLMPWLTYAYEQCRE